MLTCGLKMHAVMKIALTSHRRKSTEYWKMMDKELHQRVSWSIKSKYKSYSTNSRRCSLICTNDQKCGWSWQNSIRCHLPVSPWK